MAFFPLGRLELKIYPLLTLIVSTLSLHLGKKDKEKKIKFFRCEEFGFQISRFINVVEGA